MKKIAVAIVIVLLIIAAGGFSSYLEAKKQAKKVVQSFPGQLSPLSTQLVLFGSPNNFPCWVFRAEYSDLMTGATFDVYVSLWGNVFKIPPLSDMPE